MKVNYTRPWLTQYQKDILNSEARFTVTQASTKTGKTASHIIWLFEQALMGKAGFNYWWCAPSYSQAKIAFGRMKKQISYKSLYTANNSDLTITLINGAVLWFKTAEKPDNLFGEDVYAAVFDEFTRAREEAWTALRTTLTATKGKCKFIGNVKGRRNWGHKLWLRAKEEGEFEAFKITYLMAVEQNCPKATMEEYEQARKDLPPFAFEELYNCNPQEDSANPFGHDNIKACLVDGLSEKEPVYWGVDLAKYFDYTVIIGLDEDGNVAHLDRFQGRSWKIVEDIIINLVGDNPCCIDATGIGDPVVEAIQAELPNVEAFKYNVKTKRDLITLLIRQVVNGELSIPRDSVIEEEMEYFEFEYTRTGIKYNAPQGLHDDAVNSFALSRRCFSIFSVENEFQII